MVTSNLPRWAGDATTPFVLHLAQDLQALGWEIEVLAPHAPGAATAERLDGVSVERFRYLWPAAQQTVCYQGGALINLRRKPLNHLKLPALVAAELAAVMRRIATADYAILHSHWILPQGFVGSLARQVLRGPHLITAHGGDVFALQSAPLRAAKRWALRQADAVTVNSSVTEAAVRALIDGRQSVHRIPMGVACDGPTPSQRLEAAALRQRECPAGESLVLFIGRLVEEKGVSDLLESLALLKQKRPLRALILGDGQERKHLEQLTARLGLGERVRFAGWVDATELPVYRLAADLLVAPSRTGANGWVEAQGLSVLEAMAAELPVVATDSGGIADSIQHEQSGLLVPERDPPALAQAIERLIADPALRDRLAANARAQVTQRFSRQASAAAFDRLFRILIAQHRQNAASSC